MSNALEKVLSQLEDTTDAALERLFAILRIPSISTDPEYDASCKQAAQWCADQLAEISFTARVHPTAGKPMVVAHWKSDAPNAKHILFYGHYDVQPADPLELWETPPFEPRLADDPEHGKIIVSRGASDDKGQFMTFFEACRAWKETSGALPCSVTVLLEGEEESGSPSLPAFLEARSDALKADYAYVCDTTQPGADRPAITTSLRGLAHVEVVVKAANRDLHSGMYGGAAMNPIRGLARALAALHDDEGRVCIPGFYDGIVDPTSEQLEQWRTIGVDADSLLGPVGLSSPAGETGRSIPELLWARPTAEINGIIGGYTGPGTKTVIPAEVSAKLTFRLVNGQDPAKILANFRQFITDHLPADCKAEFKGVGGSPAITFDTSLPIFRNAANVLAQEWGTDAIMTGSGGSIPIVGAFKSKLGMDTALIGFALDDDRIHSPNEKYNLKSFRKGARSWARILATLGQ